MNEEKDKALKKILLMVMAVCLISSCATLTNFLCHPTQDQINAAQIGKAVAQQLLALTGLNVLAEIAIPTFDRVVQGYCSTQARWDAAVTAIEQAKSQSAPSMRMTFQGASSSLEDLIDKLKQVKWKK